MLEFCVGVGVREETLPLPCRRLALVLAQCVTTAKDPKLAFYKEKIHFPRTLAAESLWLGSLIHGASGEFPAAGQHPSLGAKHEQTWLCAEAPRTWVNCVYNNPL